MAIVGLNQVIKGKTMIKYFTFMVLTYFVQGEQVTHNIMFSSYDGCSYSKAAMYAIMENEHDDVLIHCKGTPVASNMLIKPRPRPEIGS